MWTSASSELLKSCERQLCSLNPSLKANSDFQECLKRQLTGSGPRVMLKRLRLGASYVSTNITATTTTNVSNTVTTTNSSTTAVNHVGHDSGIVLEEGDLNGGGNSPAVVTESAPEAPTSVEEQPVEEIQRPSLEAATTITTTTTTTGAAVEHHSDGDDEKPLSVIASKIRHQRSSNNSNNSKSSGGGSRRRSCGTICVGNADSHYTLDVKKSRGVARRPRGRPRIAISDDSESTNSSSLHWDRGCQDLSVTITPGSKDGPLTFNIQVPAVHNFTRSVKLNFALGALLLPDGGASKPTPTTTAAAAAAARRQRSKEKAAPPICQQSAPLVATISAGGVDRKIDLSGEMQNIHQAPLNELLVDDHHTTAAAGGVAELDDETLKGYVDSVLVDPTNCNSEDWAAANALENINNNIGDNYNVQMSSGGAPMMLPPGAEPAIVKKPVKKRGPRKVTATGIAAAAGIEGPKKRGRKPKKKAAPTDDEKGDLARYIELFSNNCDQAGSPNSTQMVTSTTQNLDFAFADMNGTTQFSDLVDYINSAAGNADTNAAGRDNPTVNNANNNKNHSETNECMNAPTVMTTSRAATPTTAPAIINVSDCEVLQMSTTTSSAGTVTHMYTSPSLGAQQTPVVVYLPASLATTAATAHVGNVGGSQRLYLQQDQPKVDVLDLSVDKQELQARIGTLRETESFKAALDMPPLESVLPEVRHELDEEKKQIVMEEKATATTTTTKTTKENYASSVDATAATTNLPMEFTDLSSKALYEQLLDVDCCAPGSAVDLPNQGEAVSLFEDNDLHVTTSRRHLTLQHHDCMGGGGDEAANNNMKSMPKHNGGGGGDNDGGGGSDSHVIDLSEDRVQASDVNLSLPLPIKMEWFDLEENLDFTKDILSGDETAEYIEGCSSADLVLDLTAGEEGRAERECDEEKNDAGLLECETSQSSLLIKLLKETNSSPIDIKCSADSYSFAVVSPLSIVYKTSEREQAADSPGECEINESIESVATTSSSAAAVTAASPRNEREDEPATVEETDDDAATTATTTTGTLAESNEVAIEAPLAEEGDGNGRTLVRLGHMTNSEMHSPADRVAVDNIDVDVNVDEDAESIAASPPSKPAGQLLQMTANFSVYEFVPCLMALNAADGETNVPLVVVEPIERSQPDAAQPESLADAALSEVVDGRASVIDTFVYSSSSNSSSESNTSSSNTSSSSGSGSASFNVVSHATQNIPTTAVVVDEAMVDSPRTASVEQEPALERSLDENTAALVEKEQQRAAEEEPIQLGLNEDELDYELDDAISLAPSSLSGASSPDTDRFATGVAAAPATAVRPKLTISLTEANRRITTDASNGATATPAKATPTAATTTPTTAVVVPTSATKKSTLVTSTPTAVSATTVSAFCTIESLFGVSCLPSLVNGCLQPNFCMLRHVFNTPDVVAAIIKELSNSELDIAYTLAYNHRELFMRYFALFCEAYASRRNRNKLFKLIYDCQRYAGCTESIYCVYQALVVCGLNPMHACRNVVQRVIDRSPGTIDVLIGVIISGDWTIMYEELVRFAMVPEYSFRFAVLQQMVHEVLRTLRPELVTAYLHCLFKVRLDEVHLTHSSKEITHLIDIVSQSNPPSGNSSLPTIQEAHAPSLF